MRALCARCRAPLERGDLRCSVCAMAVPAAAPEAAQTRARVVRCEGCGAALSYDVEAQAPRCAFCGAVMHVEAVEDPLEQAEAALPFTVDGSTARQALRSCLRRRGPFAPGDLASESTVASLQPLWWPAWLFAADAEVTWAADSNAGAGRAAWAPHAGRAHLAFSDILVPASRGLSAEECAALAPSFDFARAGAARGPEGARTEQFDVQRSAARRSILETAQRLATERLKAGEIPGSTYRNIHVSLVLEGLRTRRLSLPTYVLAYRYRGKLYRALVHGQQPSAVFGTAPLSGWKIAAAALPVLVLLALLWLLVRR